MKFEMQKGLLFISEFDNIGWSQNFAFKAS